MKTAFSKPTKTEAERRELFETFLDYGYDGLQLKGEYKAYLDDPRRMLVDWPTLDGHISALIVYGQVEDVAAALPVAEQVGADLVVYPPSQKTDDVSPADLPGLIEQFAELGRRALDVGTKLSLHHHHDSILETIDQCDRFFDRGADTPFGLTVDTGHVVKSGMDDVAGFIRRYAECIDNFHLKDYQDGRFTVLGEGDIDFGPILEAIRGIEYGGWVSADEESGATMAHAMRACRDVLGR